ncbi:peptidoglycan recognition protein family protein [Parasulfitobacter algicola]|uniref:N-acetylmuramoyl-L-alanine amidase n=1 Tax=Parasulfitobacter algicola TaxID=2614809 RepID=A0ABX2INC1_9RHOB|nr:peptidoglycan-binding domain-containing protein [Sulfitobacter algicola]NSX54045.1 N-acetylmuramoyl-L-alanine amidase [Sulfitobacter algicola]
MFTKPSRQVDRVFLHCSASDHANHDNVSTIRRWHMDAPPKGRGWSDIGYHYFIRKNGTLENGRSLEKTPAAQAGHNKSTIAICLHGLHVSKFTEAQFDRLKELCVEINNAYGGRVTFHGHNEVAAKACPVFDYAKVLKLDDFGRLGLSGAAKQKTKTVTGNKPDTFPILRQGDRGSAVIEAQRMLFIKPDGIFGPKTAVAVREFRTKNNLGREAIIDHLTWKALLETAVVEHFD